MGVIDEKTKIPLSLVISGVGFVALIIFAWAALSNSVANANEKISKQEAVIQLLIAQQAQVTTQLAVIDAKQSTAIEQIERIRLRLESRGH